MRAIFEQQSAASSSHGSQCTGDAAVHPGIETPAGPAGATERFRRAAAVLALLLLWPGYERAAAQEPILLVDIAKKGVPASFAPEITPAPGIIFLRASTAESGLELWRTDGTDEGTSLVEDIRPGPEGSTPERLAVLGNILVFTADDGQHGREIWASDGTEGGTLLLEDIVPGAVGSRPSSLTAVGGTVYFLVDGAEGFEDLWKTDGTPEGTALVTAVPRASRLTSALGLLFLSAGTEATGAELWKSDGTPGGTGIIKDLRSGESGSFPDLFTAGDGVLYFRTTEEYDGGIDEFEVRKTDGTEKGTVLVKDFGTREPRGMALHAGTLYLGVARVSDDDGVVGGSIWKSDGTPTGTTEVKSFVLTDSDEAPYGLTSLGEGILFFMSFDGRSRSELWKSNGTPEGTVRLLEGESFFHSPVVVGDAVLFVAQGPGNTVSIWETDGTAPNTKVVKSFSSEAEIVLDSFVAAPGGAYFSVSDPAGREIWKTDGTPEGTVLVAGSFDLATETSFPTDFTKVGSACLFIAQNGSAGGESLWRSDGTPQGTALVKEIVAAEEGYISRVAAAGDTLYLSIQKGPVKAIWKSDGTEEGTSEVVSFPAEEVAIYALAGAGGKAYFAIDDPVHSYLWVTDGTSGGTEEILGQVPGIEEQTDVGGSLYFVTGNFGSSTKLWKTDGSPEGTELLESFVPDPDTFRLHSLTPWNGSLWFLANESSASRAGLWKSDGTEEGTTPVKTFLGDFQPTDLIAAGSVLYLFTFDGNETGQLWKSDGTGEGTVFLKEFGFDPFHFQTTEPEAANGILYFEAHVVDSGSQLWKSDGTAEGTGVVSDLVSSPRTLRAAGNQLYFSAYGALAGLELWRTDGTPDGTVLVRDFLPGPKGSEPLSLAFVNGSLFLTADDGVHGYEPWAIPSSEPPAVRGDSNQDGKIDISDAVYLLSCLFLGETCPDDPCGIDIDGDSLSNITDPIFLLDYLFRGGPEPPPCP